MCVLVHITTSRKAPKLQLATVLTGVVGSAASAAVAAVVTRELQASRIRSARRAGKSAHRPWSTRSLWATKASDETVFNQGNVAQMIEALPRLEEDSPAAAIALVSFLSQQRGDNRGWAQSRLAALLCSYYPHASAISSAKAGRAIAKDVRDDRLTADMSLHEVDYLSYIHGLLPRWMHLSQLAEKLEKTAEALASRDSQRRQTSARIILADIYRRQGRLIQANQQLGLALVLMGAVYQQPGLIELATNASHPPERVGSSSQVPENH